MTVFESVSAWRHERQAQIRGGVTLGVVPTMGALHEGHLSLVRRSRAENDCTLVTIFVNRMQFNDAGDFSQYPRTLDDDVALLRAEGVEYVLAPDETQLYPDGYRYRITETERSQGLEGVHRPGHFDAVLTVVLKLLQIAQAERAYFGEKDWQQLTLVQGLVAAFFVSTVIVPCATVREADGLALSSRNRLLAMAERRKAPELYRVLSTSSTADAACRRLRAAGFDVEYVEEWDGRRLAAVRLGGVRLIDNVPLEVRP